MAAMVLWYRLFVELTLGPEKAKEFLAKQRKEMKGEAESGNSGNDPA